MNLPIKSKSYNFCPYCGVSLQGQPIPPEDREFFGNRTHFKREIGTEDPEVYDGILKFRCPDCDKEWSAF